MKFDSLKYESSCSSFLTHELQFSNEFPFRLVFGSKLSADAFREQIKLLKALHKWGKKPFDVQGLEDNIFR